MSPYSWSLLNACTIIKHALAVFHIRIPPMSLQKLVGEMRSIYTKSGWASQFTAAASANIKQNHVEWGAPETPSLTLRCHNNQHLLWA